MVSFSRRSSSSSVSTLASTTASTRSTIASSTFDLLEPVDLSHLPVELVAASLKQPTKSHSHAHHHHEHRPRCTLDSEDEKFDSIFSFPRNYTTHVRCPKHGIVHDPALALPERNSRETSSFESSCSSIKSTRSLKCALKRVVSLKRP
ncbi:hypothetical protein RTBOTA2_004557 [Rhodotorula toruloides]|nr:hypothetical protein RTBOTA2_004557 [Rhodotorula toruloides]